MRSVRISGRVAAALHALHMLDGYDPRAPLDPGAVRHAFAEAVKAAHPDAGGTGGDIQVLKEARDYLLCVADPATHQKPACVFCGGRGNISFGFTTTVCTRCRGTGEAE
jgi:hypothetical protein